MPELNALRPSADWVEVLVTEADWENADPALLGTFVTQLHLIRAFEEAVLELAAEGLVHGPAHSSVDKRAARSDPLWALAPRITYRSKLASGASRKFGMPRSLSPNRHSNSMEAWVDAVCTAKRRQFSSDAAVAVASNHFQPEAKK